MTSIDPTARADSEVLANRTRLEALSKRLFEPLTQAIKRGALGLLLASIATAAAGTASSDFVVAGAVALAGGVLSAAVAWSWLRSPTAQAGIEVLLDHGLRDQRAWEVQTGTSLPTSVRRAERWLRDHPDNPGRPTALVRLGRIAEARDLLRAATPRSDEERLELDVVERQADLYEGQRPTTDDLHLYWRGLVPSPERDRLRWCLAMLDAQLAAEAGRNPLPILAEARPDVTDVDPSVRAAGLVRNVIVGHALAVVVLWFVAAFATA